MAFLLDLTQFIPGLETPIGSAAVDPDNHRVVLNKNDIPITGGLLEITVLTQYIRSQETDATTATLIANSELNGSDGIIEKLIKDESIIDSGAAKNRAFNELKLLIQPNITLTFSTKQNGWEPGQQFTFIDDNATPPINIVLTVQEVQSKLLSTIGTRDEFQHTVKSAPYIVDPDALLAKSVARILRPPRPPIATIIPST